MKRITILTMFALAVAITASAQQRKGTVRRAPAAKPATQASKTTGPANFAIVHMSDLSLEKPLAEGPDCLYFIEQLGRSVLSLDKKTGTLNQYIPGGRDKMITAIGHDGKDLYLMVTNVGLVRYDGQSRETSPCLYPTSDYGKGLIGHQAAFDKIVFSPNKRWLVAIGNGALLFDLANGGCKFVREYTHSATQEVFPQDDGTMIAVTTHEVVVIPPTAAQIVKRYEAEKCGAKEYKIKSDFTSACVRDGRLYASWNRFIACTPLPLEQAVEWKMQYQLANEDNRIRHFAMGPQRMLAECEEFGEYYCQWDTTDFSQQPKVTGTLVTTVMNPVTKKPYEQRRNGDMLYYDQQGNLIMYGYDNLDIYNPDGIKGYESLKNKRTRYKSE